MDTIQQVTIKFKFNNKYFQISMVYSRCSALERLELWEELQSVDLNNTMPWIVGVTLMSSLMRMKSLEDWLLNNKRL